MNNNLIKNINSILNDTNNQNITSLYNDMSRYQKNIFDNLKSNEDFLSSYSLNDLIFDFDTNFVENLLKIELDAYLEYCNENGIYNKKNGSTKCINLTIGNREINFNRPRLRKEKNFDSILIPKRTRIIDDLSNNIILLYSKNNSVNDIKDILCGMFNINVSSALISNITSKLADQVLEWRNKQLKNCYFTINVDCLYITLRDNKNINSHKVPVYIAVGTTLDGHKEIVGMYLGNEDANKNIIDSLTTTDISEATSFWLEVFGDLKDRGVERILYFISDGVTGIENAIKNEFPNTTYQRCVVHIVRNLKKYTTKIDCKNIINDFKEIYTAPNKDIAISNYEEFRKKYKDKKVMLKHAETYFNLILPLFNVPLNIRKYIYTNNIVESVNSKIQRGFYGRGALPNSSSSLNIIYVNLIDLEKKWAKTHVPNWNNILNELKMVHKNDFDIYLN